MHLELLTKLKKPKGVQVLTQSADKHNMTRRIKENSPWADWLGRDDRTWISNFDPANPPDISMPDSAFPSPFRTLVRFIVSSVESASQTHLSVGFLPPQTANLCKTFEAWYLKSNEIQLLTKQWESESSGPWSFPLALLRSYSRFKAQVDQSDFKKTSIQAQELEAHIMMAFQNMTEALNDFPTMKTVYQLHLEGILENEISWITEIPIPIVNELILEAKGRLLPQSNHQKQKRNSS